MQYVIDGIPLYDNRSPAFAQSLGIEALTRDIFIEGDLEAPAVFRTEVLLSFASQRSGRVHAHDANLIGISPDYVVHVKDSVLATFDGPGRALRAALEASRLVGHLGLEMRAGIHTGEIELRGNDIGGIAVNVAARIAAIAGPGTALVSNTVRDLVAGSGLRFEDRGRHALKGLPEELQLYAVLGGAA